MLYEREAQENININKTRTALFMVHFLFLLCLNEMKKMPHLLCGSQYCRLWMMMSPWTRNVLYRTKQNFQFQITR